MSVNTEYPGVESGLCQLYYYYTHSKSYISALEKLIYGHKSVLFIYYFERVGGWVVRRCHVSFVTRGVQLILADSWARPAILVAGKGREVMFLFLLFLHFHSCFSFFPVPPFHLFCYLFCLFSPFLWETTQNDPQGLTCR